MTTKIKEPDFQFIQQAIIQERSAFLKANHIEEDEDQAGSSVRSEKDILFLIPELSNIYKKLAAQLKKNPGFLEIYEKLKLPINIMFKEQFIIEALFLDEFLLPKLKHVEFSTNENNWKASTTHFSNWIQSVEDKHDKTSEFIREEFNVNLNLSELDCSCIQCKSEFRTKLRDGIFSESKKIIEDKFTLITEYMDKEIGNDDVANQFYLLQKELEKLLTKFKYQLKKASVKRLDSNLKSIIFSKFYGKSELAQKRILNVTNYLKSILEERKLDSELITSDMYDKFFDQLELKVWKTERTIEREFTKLLNSLLILKRHDISGTILKDYIGNFWAHSLSRSINRKIIYHLGPTNSGKTYHAIQALCKAKTGCYLAPLRLLAGELSDTMNGKGVITTLLTGEEVVERDGATHYSSTIEMAKLSDHFDCCVIDEIQMITDRQRGWAWTRALVNMFADEIHICGDGSVLELVQNVVDLCGDTLEVKNYERMTELNVESRPILLTEMQKSDALIVFSRRNALRYKRDLEKLGYKVSIVYGRLSPEVRREQARKFDNEETDIMVSTDAIAMGMNLPIKRIVFSTLSKYIDGQEHVITDSEIKQIAGRAGRYQRFPTGYVTCLERVESGMEIISESLSCELVQKTNTMVGADLDIFNQVNSALIDNKLPSLKLSEFLRLFNTMEFQEPFKCVELKEMIEVSEMVEEADARVYLTDAEIFGFACAPVNLGLMDHVQYFIWIVNNYVNSRPIAFQEIDPKSHDIDYLETSIKCMELYQWLSRHFSGKNFDFNENDLIHNKSHAVDKLNELLSEKIVPTCRSCGCKLAEKSEYAICEDCFKKRRFTRPGGYAGKKKPYDKERRGNSTSGSGKKKHHRGGGSSSFSKKKTENRGKKYTKGR